MSGKKFAYLVVSLLLLLLLLPGNIYIVYKSCIGPRSAEERGFVVEGDGNDFLCRWRSNGVLVTVRNDNIIAVGAAADGSDFFWGVTEGYFVLNYNNAMAIDFNKDFLADFIAAYDKKKSYIQLNGRLEPVASYELKALRFTLQDGRTFVWREGRWQPPAQKGISMSRKSARRFSSSAL